MSRTGCRNPPAPQRVLLWSSVPKLMLIGATKAQCSIAIKGRPDGTCPSHACTSYPRVVSRTAAGRYFSKFHDKFVHKSWQAVAFWVPGCAKNVSFAAGAIRSQIDIVRAHTGGEASCLADHVRLKPLSTQQHVQRATVHSSAPFFVETIMVGKINRRNRPWQADPTLFARDAAEPTVR